MRCRCCAVVQCEAGHHISSPILCTVSMHNIICEGHPRWLFRSSALLKTGSARVLHPAPCQQVMRDHDGEVALLSSSHAEVVRTQRYHMQLQRRALRRIMRSAQAVKDQVRVEGQRVGWGSVTAGVGQALSHLGWA